MLEDPHQGREGRFKPFAEPEDISTSIPEASGSPGNTIASIASRFPPLSLSGFSWGRNDVAAQRKREPHTALPTVHQDERTFRRCTEPPSTHHAA